MHRSYPPQLTKVLSRPKRYALWCSKARIAIGRDVKGFLEVALGSRAVDASKAADEHVPCWVLVGATDEVFALLASLEEYGTGDRLDKRLEAMILLLDHGVPLSEAGYALGLAHRSDACRLHAMRHLSPRVLRALSDAGKSENHGRWLLGLERDEALALLAGRRTSVGALKAARRKKASLSIEVADALPSEADEDPNLVQEAARIGEWLSAPVRLRWKEGRGVLEVGFADVVSLAGVLEKLGRGYGADPTTPEGRQMRWMRIPLESSDELAYLAGTSES